MRSIPPTRIKAKKVPVAPSLAQQVAAILAKCPGVDTDTADFAKAVVKGAHLNNAGLARLFQTAWLAAAQQHEARP